jgi:hypothetical protein
MSWLRKLLGVRPKPAPVPPSELKPEPRIGDPGVEISPTHEETIQKREKAQENGEGRNLEEV